MAPPIPGWRKAVEKLSTSQLFWFVTVLFLVDLAVPDPLPFVDEVLLGLVSILVARWQLSRATTDDEEPHKPPPKDVTPDG